MNMSQFEFYWNELPTGVENAVSYDELCERWGFCQRKVRQMLHDLSGYDNGDNVILIRSSKGKGFYKTDDEHEIRRYREECLSRGKRTFAPLRKIDRVLRPNDGQMNIENNLKTIRLGLGMKQSEVCSKMVVFDPAFDEVMLSKMENNKCFPTPLQLAHLASIYGCTARDLVNMDYLSRIV